MEDLKSRTDKLFGAKKRSDAFLRTIIILMRDLHMSYTEIMNLTTYEFKEIVRVYSEIVEEENKKVKSKKR